jgi:hypothetical protein
MLMNESMGEQDEYAPADKEDGHKLNGAFAQIDGHEGIVPQEEEQNCQRKEGFGVIFFHGQKVGVP